MILLFIVLVATVIFFFFKSQHELQATEMFANLFTIMLSFVFAHTIPSDRQEDPFCPSMHSPIC